MPSWHEPKESPRVYWDLWEGTSDPYALLAWGRSLDKVNRVFKRKEKVA